MKAIKHFARMALLLVAAALVLLVETPAFSQTGSVNVSTLRSTVADSTTVTGSAAYGLLYYNHQKQQWRFRDATGTFNPRTPAVNLTGYLKGGIINNTTGSFTIIRPTADNSQIFSIGQNSRRYAVMSLSGTSTSIVGYDGGDNKSALSAEPDSLFISSNNGTDSAYLRLNATLWPGYAAKFNDKLAIHSLANLTGGAPRTYLWPDFSGDPIVGGGSNYLTGHTYINGAGYGGGPTGLYDFKIGSLFNNVKDFEVHAQEQAAIYAGGGAFTLGLSTTTGVSMGSGLNGVIANVTGLKLSTSGSPTTGSMFYQNAGGYFVPFNPGTNGNTVVLVGGVPAYSALALNSSNAVGSSVLQLANGGLASALTDPGANKLLAWDDTDNTNGYWTVGSGLSYDHATHTISAPGGITPAALTKTDDTNVTLTLGGTPATALLQTTSLTLGWTGRLAYSRLTQGSGVSLLGVTGSSTADNASIVGTADQVYRVNGAGTAVAAGSIDLNKSATVGSTVLKGINGGTDQSSYVVGDVLTANTTTTLSKVTAGAAGTFVRYAGAGVVPAASVLVLPNSATVNQLVYATALNTWGSSANFIYDGTRLALNATVTNNNAFGITMPVTLTGDDNAVMKIGGAGSTTTLRATSGDKFYTFASDGTIVTGATNQTIRWLQQIATYTTNHTGARIDGLYFNPTLAGSQTPVVAHVLATGSLVMGAITPATNALVDLRSTTKGVQLPAMTTTQRDAITGSDGLLVANTTTHKIDYHNGTSWGPIADGEAQVTISTAALLTGNSVPVLLLAAPGAGKLIVVTSPIVCKFKYGSAIFSTVPTYRFYYGPGTSSFTSGTNTSSSLTQTADNIIFVNAIENGSTATTLENAGVYFKIDSTDPTGGTGSTLVVYFKYRIVTL